MSSVDIIDKNKYRRRKKAKEPILLQLHPDLIQDLQTLAEKHGISRQALIQAILIQALQDKNFKIELS